MRDSFGHMLLRVHIRALALCCGLTGQRKAACFNRGSWFAPDNLWSGEAGHGRRALSYLRSSSDESRGACGIEVDSIQQVTNRERQEVSDANVALTRLGMRTGGDWTVTVMRFEALL